MIDLEPFMIFLCSGAAKAGEKKLSFRIASYMEHIGIGKIGNLENLSAQHACRTIDQKRMIFINDCRSGCVNVLTQGFSKEKYIYVDVSPLHAVKDLDITAYIHEHVLPALQMKWNYQPK